MRRPSRHIDTWRTFVGQLDLKFYKYNLNKLEIKVHRMSFSISWMRRSEVGSVFEEIITTTSTKPELLVYLTQFRLLLVKKNILDKYVSRIEKAGWVPASSREPGA